MTGSDREFRVLEKALHRLEGHLADLPAMLGDGEWDELYAVVSDVADRLADNYPYLQPMYAGQMLKPPHPVAFGHVARDLRLAVLNAEALSLRALVRTLPTRLTAAYRIISTRNGPQPHCNIC